MNETRGTGSFAIEFKFKKEGTSEVLFFVFAPSNNF